MRPVSPSQRQVCFSAALTAAAAVLVSPSLPWPSPAPAASLDAAVTRPSRTDGQPVLAQSQVFASRRAGYRPVAPLPSSPPPSQPRVSDDLESAAVISSPSPVPMQREAVQAPAPAVKHSAPAYPSYTPVPSRSGAYGPPETHSAPPVSTSSFQSCVIARESGGNPQVMNASGHYGLYQFSASTWAAYGGNPADFGHASVAEQNQVFNNAMAAGGESNWAPYDGC